MLLKNVEGEDTARYSYQKGGRYSYQKEGVQVHIKKKGSRNSYQKEREVHVAAPNSSMANSPSRPSEAFGRTDCYF